MKILTIIEYLKDHHEYRCMEEDGKMTFMDPYVGECIQDAFRLEPGSKVEFDDDVQEKFITNRWIYLPHSIKIHPHALTPR